MNRSLLERDCSGDLSRRSISPRSGNECRIVGWFHDLECALTQFSPRTEVLRYSEWRPVAVAVLDNNPLEGRLLAENLEALSTGSVCMCKHYLTRFLIPF
ncbi:MAG: hypothetical protein HON65_06560 [Rhodospirillales bacterium]|nr:hypothetical protein [Rhodospirillales bacterium]